MSLGVGQDEFSEFINQLQDASQSTDPSGSHHGPLPLGEHRNCSAGSNEIPWAAAPTETPPRRESKNVILTPINGFIINYSPAKSFSRKLDFQELLEPGPTTATPISLYSDSFYDSQRDPRLSETPNPGSICLQHSPDISPATPSKASSAQPFNTAPRTEQLSTVTEIDKLSIEDEESFHDSFHEDEIEIPATPRSSSLAYGSRNLLPALLFRTWTEKSGGYNSALEFRPGLAVDKVQPPERSNWDNEFLTSAAKHFGRVREPSPFISFSKTQMAIKAKESKRRNPFITILHPAPARSTFLHAFPICRAVAYHPLADSKVKKYGASAEWFHWGTLRAADYTEEVFLSTVSLADLIALAEQHPYVVTILRLDILKNGGSITTILKTIVRSPTICDEHIASGLGLIARICGFSARSKHDHIQNFVLELANDFAIQPCPEEFKDMVAASFMRTLTEDNLICQIFSKGVKRGFDRLEAWAHNHATRMEEAARRAAEEGWDFVAKKVPWNEQGYYARHKKDEESTPRVTRSQSAAGKNQRSSRYRSISRGRHASRGAYHPERLVRSRSLGTNGRKRERAVECIGGVKTRRKMVCVELS